MSSTLVTAFQSSVNELAASVSRLDEAVSRRSLALVKVRRGAVESALRVASGAAAALGQSNTRPTAELQSQWTSVLTAMQGSLRRADDLLADAEASGAMPGPMDSGFQIPGTNVIVPYVALVAIAAVAGVAWYVTKRKR